jgi:hypothetical protein
MSEDAVGYVLLIVGALLVAGFAVVNFRFDHARAHKPVAGEMALADKRTRRAMGTFEATLFFVGVILFSAGCAIFLTRGYGSF